MGLDWLSVIILGIVEGVTEFLPISSTGHLILTGHWLNIDENRANLFYIMIQGAAILAVIWEYRSRLLTTACQLRSSSKSRHFVFAVAIAFVPLAILGLLFKKSIEHYLFNPMTVGVVLLVGGVVMWVAEKKLFKHHHPVKIEAEDVSLKQALIIGFCQSLALIPGTSRSAATLLGGMFLGLSRKAAAEFSFFLAIPTLLMATFYQAYKALNQFSSHDWGVFLVGGIVAFVSALLSIRGFIRWLSNHSLELFAYYRIIVGAIIILYFSHI